MIRVQKLLTALSAKNMAKYTINPELDERLRLSLENPGSFMEDLSLVYAFHQFPVLVPKEVFFVPLEDHKAIPVFTTEKELEVFLSELEDFETEWELHSLVDLLDQLMPTDIDVVAINPKLPQDEDRGNTVYFGKSEFMQFLVHYTDILNKAFSPENLQAPQADKYYFVPAFVTVNNKRHFPNLMSETNQEYLPLFDNLDSLSKWYGEAYFSKEFKENNGQVLFMKLPELLHPTDDADNDFGRTVGITVNPLDYSQEDVKNSMITWEELGL
ncbi:hypothetical protein AALA94_07200 [Lactococcus taiwanensis]|uniref:hypothetical protein n=2 Tax=Lactococcus taiwanensis TaxID=1151742 RepID=UPI003514D4BB